jgi:HTH-type transcriptional regulator/antitoxin HipB
MRAKGINMKVSEIGGVIKYHRKQNKLSRLELANLAGVGKTVIYDIEKVKETVQFKSLLRVLEVLNIQLKLVSPFNEKLDDTQ